MTGKIMWTILKHLNEAEELERESTIIRSIHGVTNKSIPGRIRVPAHKALKRLENEGLITRHYDERPDKKTKRSKPHYELTDKGTEKLHKQQPGRGEENNDHETMLYLRRS